ncbi:MAG TPA: penicillin-binding transpeptidase domain-containing protein [Pyrinomonadaceae bacterium]|nr:penicillin-binding transpeptidase domain-containing protein [Pyrinomonadaceae bacterium]
MPFSTHSPRSLRVLTILFVIIILSFSDAALGKRRQSAGSRKKVTRVQKGKKVSARVRRSTHRRGRLSARNTRRGRRSRLSAREVRRQRKLVAKEQASAIKALERRLRRPLTRRERSAELRRIELRHRRDLLAARRRAEAARQAAIARRRALEKAMRDEALSFIAMDDPTGEDPEVRRVAVNALGNHAGTVVVMDPITGRIYAAVNQEWGFRRGFKPCSTIKLVTGIAGLREKVITPVETAEISDRYHIDLTDALAYSNNTYFQQVGGKVGFEKMIGYARELGLGEKTGVNVANEYPGQLPVEKNGFALNRMCSHGDDFEVTAVQLATLVSAMANGGRLLVPQVPRTRGEEAKFKPRVRRQLDVEQEFWRRMVPGMVGAVNYGSGKKAYDPLQTVAGKTGTCIGQGSWLGLFTSYAPLANPRLAVVVITRGSDARGHFPAAVAGQIYRELNSRFGTPVNLQIATAPVADDSKAAELNEEEKDAAEEEAAEAETSTSDESTDAASEATASAGPAAPQNSGNVTPRNTVKRVLMPIERHSPDIKKGEVTKPAATRVTPEFDGRPRRIQPERR